MLRREVSQRADVVVLLQQDWLSEPAGESLDDQDQLDLSSSGELLLACIHRSQLERITAQHCVRQLPHRRLRAITKKFKELDIDGNSQLSLDELKNGLKKLCSSTNQKSSSETAELSNALKVFEALDTDQSGYISWSEFAAGALRLPTDTLDHLLWQFFQALDADQSSFIDSDELYATLHLLQYGVHPDHLTGDQPEEEPPSEVSPLHKTVEQMISDIDCNGDGMVAFDELKKYMKREL